MLRSGILPISLKATLIFMLGSKLDNNINIVMDDIAVTSTDCLEVSIDTNLRFDEHISKISEEKQSTCRSPYATQKLNSHWY